MFTTNPITINTYAFLTGANSDYFEMRFDHRSFTIQLEHSAEHRIRAYNACINSYAQNKHHQQEGSKQAYPLRTLQINTLYYVTGINVFRTL